MGMFDTVQMSADVLGDWSVCCRSCGTLVSGQAQWQTKSLEPCMADYYLRHAEGGVRLFRLDAPAKRYWRPWTDEEIEESRRLADERGGIFAVFVKQEGDGTYLPEAYLPKHRRQRAMGELPHQWVQLYASCRCGAWVEQWLKFTDGVVDERRDRSPFRTPR